jgi:hypothetical protein
MASYYVLAAASPLVKEGSSLSTPGSAEERHLNSLVTLGHAAPAPAPADSSDDWLGGVFALSAAFAHHLSDGFRRFSDAVITSSAKLHPTRTLHM